MKTALIANLTLRDDAYESELVLQKGDRVHFIKHKSGLLNSDQQNTHVVTQHFNLDNTCQSALLGSEKRLTGRCEPSLINFAWVINSTAANFAESLPVTHHEFTAQRRAVAAHA